MTGETTHLYDIDEFNEAVAEKTLKDVAEILEERGYNSINQIVGYIMSGDPGYISNYKEARSKICKIERIKLLELMVKSYIK